MDTYEIVCEQAYNELEEDILLHSKKWKNGKNEIIPTSKLSTQHLINIINKIKKTKWREDYLDVMEEELKKRI